MYNINKPEEKALRRFYATNILSNIYGLNREFATIISEFINNFYENLFNSSEVGHVNTLDKNYLIDTLSNKYNITGNLLITISDFTNEFYENFFKEFDYEKLKHIRNAQSNLGFAYPVQEEYYKITFYIGLMDKDTLTYTFSLIDAINEVVNILGDCTILKCKGSFQNQNKKRLIVDTLQVVQYIKEIPDGYIHFKSKELKTKFNQNSILTDIEYAKRIQYNDEPEEYDNEIKLIMKEYDLTWDKAVRAYNSGLY